MVKYPAAEESRMAVKPFATNAEVRMASSSTIEDRSIS